MNGLYSWEIRSFDEQKAICNPLADLISRRMRQLGVGPAEIVRRSGYSSVNGGLKALCRTLETGGLHALLGKKLAQALQISDQELQRAVQSAAFQLEAKEAWRRRHAERIYIEKFKPYIMEWFESGRPRLTSTTLLGGIYSAAFIDVPVDPQSGSTDRLKQKQLVHHHFERWSGQFPIYGRIQAYAEVKAPSAPGLRYRRHAVSDGRNNRLGPDYLPTCSPGE